MQQQIPSNNVRISIPYLNSASQFRIPNSAIGIRITATPSYSIGCLPAASIRRCGIKSFIATYEYQLAGAARRKFFANLDRLCGTNGSNASLNRLRESLKVTHRACNPVGRDHRVCPSSDLQVHIRAIVIVLGNGTSISVSNILTKDLRKLK